jgi:histone H3/H4
VTPYGGFGTSLCGELFSTPWHEQNVVVTFGDFGGRMNNKIKQDQLFVVIPIQFVENITRLYVGMKMDINENLARTKPAGSPFWKKKGLKQEDYVAAGENPEIATTPKTPEPMAAAAEPPAEKNGADASDGQEDKSDTSSSGLTFTMDWSDQAKELLTKTPEGMDDFIVESAEDYAREKGYTTVTRETIAEQMEGMGMNLDEMLDDL